MKIHFTSLGCSRNLADTEKMMQLLCCDGHEMVSAIANADLVLLNTCGFLKSARKEGREVLERILAEKAPSAFLIVAGCMIPLHQKELEEAFGQKIDQFLSPKEEENIVDAVRRLETKREKRCFLAKSEKRLFTTNHFAYLKIADGCQKQCSYCIIPKIRGRLKSRGEEEILEEFNRILSLGVFEIILVAQDLGDFGKDRGEKRALVSLLQKMLQSKKDFWIRLLYLYPDEIDEDLLSLMQSDTRICPYFDLPIQHINTRILSLMKRSSSKQKIIESIEKLRHSFPDVSLRTSLMVGFPSETEEEFQELCHFIQTAQLDQVGIFRYSNEKEALASSLPGQIPELIKKKRERVLSSIQWEIVERKNHQKIGKKTMALVEKLHPESPYLAMARSQMQAPEVDGVILINDIGPIESFGKIYPVEITGCAGYDLIGQVIVDKKHGKKR